MSGCLQESNHRGSLLRRGPYPSTDTFLQRIYCVQLLMFVYTGLEIATDTVANATNIFSLATKNSGLVAKVATRF